MINALLIFLMLVLVVIVTALGQRGNCGRCRHSITRSPRYLFGWRHVSDEPEDGHRAWPG